MWTEEDPEEHPVYLATGESSPLYGFTNPAHSAAEHCNRCDSSATLSRVAELIALKTFAHALF